MSAGLPEGVHLVPVDMTGRIVPMRSWWIEFDNDGQPVNWSGDAISERTAEVAARWQLAQAHATFNRFGARLVACIER